MTANTTMPELTALRAPVVRQAPPPAGRAAWLRRGLFHAAFRVFITLHNLALAFGLVVAKLQRRRPRAGRSVLLTGRFESDNWLRAHLNPLAAAEACESLLVVSTYPVPTTAKIVLIRPPAWLVRVAGDTPARLLTFVWAALRHRPDVVGGFHLLVNGLTAIAVAPFVGARSMYFCVGGAVEALDGGVWCADGNPFENMVTPDAFVERGFHRALNACDLIVTMGSGAIRDFRRKGVRATCQIVSGGIDTDRFRPVDTPRDIDIILTGRIVPVKRIDVFLEAIRAIAQKLPDVSAVVVGDGPLRQELTESARALGIERNVRFVGYQSNVIDWLQRSRLFMLTSDSEGLSLSMMEAMLCGLPPLVSDVGDLGDLVESGVNGYLAPRRTPQAFADRAVEMLTHPTRYARFAAAARQAGLRHDAARVAERWSVILTRMGRPAAARDT